MGAYKILFFIIATSCYYLAAMQQVSLWSDDEIISTLSLIYKDHKQVRFFFKGDFALYQRAFKIFHDLGKYEVAISIVNAYSGAILTIQNNQNDSFCMDSDTIPLYRNAPWSREIYNSLFKDVYRKTLSHNNVKACYKIALKRSDINAFLALWLESDYCNFHGKMLPAFPGNITEEFIIQRMNMGNTELQYYYGKHLFFAKHQVEGLLHMLNSGFCVLHYPNDDQSWLKEHEIYFVRSCSSCAIYSHGHIILFDRGLEEMILEFKKQNFLTQEIDQVCLQKQISLNLLRNSDKQVSARSVMRLQTIARNLFNRFQEENWTKVRLAE